MITLEVALQSSGHDKFGKYTEDADAYQEVVDRLKKKHASAAAHVPAPIVERSKGASVGIITLGGC